MSHSGTYRTGPVLVLSVTTFEAKDRSTRPVWNGHGRRLFKRDDREDEEDELNKEKKGVSYSDSEPVL